MKFIKKYLIALVLLAWRAVTGIKEHWETAVYACVIALALGWLGPTLDHIDQMRQVVVSR